MPGSAQLQDLLSAVVQLIIVIIPVVITWFIRTYVRGTTAEKNLAAIVHLSNSAIDFVENLDKGGELNLPPNVKKSGFKLKLATGWLEDELKRMGINMTDTDAEKWIASEFQKRMGEVRPVKDIAEATRAAVNLVLKIQQNKLVDLPPEIDRVSYLAGLAADWVLTQLSTKNFTNISREEVLSWTRAELVERLQPGVSEPPSGDRLAKLAKEAVEYMEGLKANNRLVIQPSAPGMNIEADAAAARLLIQALEQGIPITSAQIGEAIAHALQARGQP
ncbi:MAG TPA: phage holin, LLH family [Anaerolineales bacterium]|nr:phage holin, LLH family [Anaerolineales bacterium]